MNSLLLCLFIFFVASVSNQILEDSTDDIESDFIHKWQSLNRLETSLEIFRISNLIWTSDLCKAESKNQTQCIQYSPVNILKFVMDHQNTFLLSHVLDELKFFEYKMKLDKEITEHLILTRKIETEIQDLIDKLKKKD